MTVYGCNTLQDDRIDRDLIALNQRATRGLPDFIAGAKMEMISAFPVRFEEAWVAYLAAEIYGHADTALIALTHNRGRQSRGLVRGMYELLKKAEYFVEHPDEARLEYLAMPFRDLKLMEQMQQDLNSARGVAIESAIAKVTARFSDVAAYAATHRDSKSLKEMVNSQHANLAEADKEYAFHYRRLSQTPHGTVAGMSDVFDYPDAEDIVGIKFDSRLDDPNFELQMSTIYVVTCLRLVNDVFALGREAEVVEIEVAGDAIMARLRPVENAEIVARTSGDNERLVG